MEELAKKNGFLNAAEMSNMIASVDLTKPGTIGLLRNWKESDGTKRGLIYRFPELAPASPNILQLIRDCIVELQKATHFVVKVEFTVTLDGLRVQVLINNTNQGKVYGLDHVFSTNELVGPLNFVQILNIKNRVVSACENAEKEQEKERQERKAAEIKRLQEAELLDCFGCDVFNCVSRGKVIECSSHSGVKNGSE